MPYTVMKRSLQASPHSLWRHRPRPKRTLPKKAAKAAKAEEAEAQRKASSKVILKRVERTKRKHVIGVSGLEAFGLDLKKVAKEMGKKFACGSSVTKAAAGGEEIVIQGYLSDEIAEWLLEKYKDIPEDNIEQIEDKKKKKEGSTS